ncbi:polysaccharide biosynthesis C-terminal domain-containing protein [Nonlabens sp. Asnod3-A02]|uniref:polysaccharide biosynthesis C-terminal domain-containing protein n=1 Tax=Nonlabens sp. Asnod3-A02 TaxID=3160579 RepID=UPI0038693D7F
MLDFVSKALKNRFVGYLFSRYFTYFIQFASSIFIATKLGPYYFGIWGFILLLLNYFRVINLGISNAVNILIVQNRNDKERSVNYAYNAFICLSFLFLAIILMGVYYYYYGISLFDKYEIGSMFYWVCLIAILTHINTLLMTLYRIKNRLSEIAIYQTIIPLLVAFFIFFESERYLLNYLLGAYVGGNVIALLVFILQNKVSVIGKYDKLIILEILKKGMYLFIYNICFYLIIISIRTVISVFYNVDEFGLFSFSFSLANAILLFLQAISFVIFPKVIDKLKGTDNVKIHKIISSLRNSYVTLAFLLVFIALPIFPFFTMFLEDYKDATGALQLTSLAVILYTISFGYGSYLLAQNKDKLIAALTFSCLIVNVIISLILVLIFKVNYEYVIIATMLSYTLYGYLTAKFALKYLGIKRSNSNYILEFFPIKLLIPYILAVVVVVYGNWAITTIPLIIFAVLNKKELLKLITTLKTMLSKPDIINLD